MNFFKKYLSLILALSVIISAYSTSASAESSEFTIDKADRIAGKDRYETALLASSRARKKNLVVASALDFPDALSASNIVNSKEAELLLVSDNNYKMSIPQVTGRKYETIYIVGGYKAVSAHIEKALIGIRPPYQKVERIAGQDRYETNKKTLDIAGYKDVAIVSGENFPDALASARFLQENKLGIYLQSRQEGIKLNTSPLIGYNARYIIGGENAVSYKGTGIERIAGLDRYETAQMLAKRTEAKNVIVVNAFNFPDALSAINLTNETKSDIILAGQENYKSKGIEDKTVNVIVLGGEKAVSDKMVLDTILGQVMTND